MNKSLIETQSSLLVVIDVQQRLAAAMPQETKDQVIKQIGVLLQASEALAVPTVVTEQYPKGLGPTEPALTQATSEKLNTIEKTCFSCLHCRTFADQVDGSNKKQIILTGMEAHICVLQTALDLQHSGYQVFVVEDAVCSRTQANKDNAMHRLRQEGVIVTNTESVLFEWLRDAQHPEFKTLSKLII